MSPKTEQVAAQAHSLPLVSSPDASLDTNVVNPGGGRSCTDLALGIFNGKGGIEDYISSRTYNTEAQPVWFQEHCFNIAKKCFYAQDVEGAIEKRVVLQTGIVYSKPVHRWIARMKYNQEPHELVKGVEKAFVMGKGLVTPRFSAEHYRQIGIPQVGVLSLLRDAANSSVYTDGKAGLEANRFQVASQRISQLQRKISSMAGKSEYGKISSMLESLISFSPVEGAVFAEAAAEAYKQVGDSIIKYSLMTDVLEAFDVSLNQKRSYVLLKDLETRPFEQWKEHPDLNNFIQLSQHLVQEPALLKHISREEAFSRYALRKDAVDELRLANKNIDDRLRKQGAMAATVLEDNNLAENAPSTCFVLQSWIESYLASWEIDASAKGLDPRHLARLADSRNMTAEQLERVLCQCEFDRDKVFAELRNKPIPKPHDSAAELPQSTHLTQPILEQKRSGTRVILLHSEGGRVPYEDWSQGLEKREQERLRKTLNKLAHGKLGLLKPLGSHQVDDQTVSMYEVRIHEGGLRVYFRYVSNDRIILLGGGDKDSQASDISICAQRGIEYNGPSQEERAAKLKEWDVQGQTEQG
jgi:putative addiction module killer protein